MSETDRLLHKSGNPLTHARLGDSDPLQGLCGDVSPFNTFFNKNASPPRIKLTSIRDANVDCPDCLNHKNYGLWLLSVTEIE